MPSLISPTLKQQVFKRDKFTCQKCGFLGMLEDLEVHQINLKINDGKDEISNLITLCSICHHYAPDSEEEFKKYVLEKIDGNILDTFRKSQRSISKRTKKGMSRQFKDGNVVTRAPFGYKIKDKQLIHGENSHLVQEIFQTFLNNEISLTQLSKKYNLSVNGLKKILANYAYLGKTKFDGQITDGKHQSLVSNTLFNQVQDKLKKKLRG